MEIFTQNHRDGVKTVNPRWQRAGAGAGGSGAGEGEHGGLGVRIAGAAADSPFEQHGKQGTATPVLPPRMGWSLGYRSLQPPPCPAGTVTAQLVSCWKKCNNYRVFHCSWPSLGPAGNTSYILNLW